VHYCALSCTSGSAASLITSERAPDDGADLELARPDHRDTLEVAKALAQGLFFVERDDSRSARQA